MITEGEVLNNTDVTLSGGVETIRETEKVGMQSYETKVQKLMRYVLGIFGHILNHNSKSFQIKPYAVWVV